jgi:hypothetical protein
VRSQKDEVGGLSRIKFRIEPPEFDAGVDGERPVDAVGVVVAPVRPGGDHPGNRVPVGQALALQRAQLQLSHIEPGAVFEGVVVSSLSAKRLASAGGNAAYNEVELIQDKRDPIYVGVVNVDQFLDTGGKIELRPSRSPSPRASLAAVRSRGRGWPPRRGQMRDRGGPDGQEWGGAVVGRRRAVAARFVETDHGAGGIERPLIHREHVFHVQELERVMNLIDLGYGK